MTEIRFQPGEIAKLVIVLFLASYLAERQFAISEGRRVGPFRLPEPRLLFPVVAVWAGSIGVLIGQRDLGASVLLFGAFIGMLYAATGQPSYLVVGGLLTVAGGWAAYRVFDHVARRVVAWLTPFQAYEDAGYQVAQAWFGMGTGSLAGSGLGLGRPTLIPNAETDFIFAAVAEELGFAGSMAVLAALRHPGRGRLWHRACGPATASESSPRPVSPGFWACRHSSSSAGFCGWFRSRESPSRSCPMAAPPWSATSC